MKDEPGNTDPGAPGEDGEQGSPDSETVQPGSISEEMVDIARAWSGLWVVVGGDVAIVAAAVCALFKFAGTDKAVLAAVLSSAFAAISAMTTAYFGIRESSNTAQRSIKHHRPGN